MTTAFIALGSNLKTPEKQLRDAADALAALPGCHVESISSVYQSAAVGPGEQPPYLNAVIQLSTSLPPLTLLDTLQAIEQLQGRERSERWGARTLDLDILLYDQQVINHPRLQIPHPRMTERNFVLYPLADISGEQLTLPSGRVLGSLLKHCPRGDLQRTQVSLINDLVPD
ncbi:MAG: 2-amino-4-hydroxy-6-hydroxymethyldihydropteridine diphosphokinase [Halioglobus sp.]|jgi:2-amino-4-hydroxy-6-hydroxymethyldihydropteridine diphosphokinase